MTARRAITITVSANLTIIALAITLGLIPAGKPGRYFGEGRFTTVISCVQLLVTAFFSSRIFFARQAHAAKLASISAAWVWVVIAAGFVFLAADDAFQIHERLDHTIHRTLDMQETPWTDRLDDVIIALYGLIGLVILWLCRQEICYFSQIWRPLGGGFLCLFVSVVCDTISNDEEFLGWLFGNIATAKTLRSWISVGDGAFTLLAEGFFLAAFYLSHRTAFTPRHSRDRHRVIPRTKPER
jgi:hypothetical protein